MVNLDEGAGRDALVMDDEVEEWAWFRKPVSASFAGSLGGASIRSEAFI